MSNMNKRCILIDLSKSILIIACMHLVCGLDLGVLAVLGEDVLAGLQVLG